MYISVKHLPEVVAKEKVAGVKTIKNMDFLNANEQR